ncbi:MAG: Rpn family recombination-promoting nuclease/putative transposase [Thermodesulfobacteriota bacterium]|nr:Rpn family recombination-promoting nuclease/putative transposase [Thermodesulfobacteriota bacterium]
MYTSTIMDNNQIQNPHDAFFRTVFSDPEVTRSLLQHELPQQIAAQLDFSSIKRQNGTHVSKMLQNTYSDMIFSIKLKNSESQAYIYTLFEHKSYVDNWCSLQLLKYMTYQWEEFHRQNPKDKLPPIIPLVLYHGKQGWRKNDILDLLDVDSPKLLKSYTPQFDYILWDVAQMDRDRKELSLEVRAFLQIMYHITRHTLPETLPQITQLLAQVTQDRTTTLEKIETYLRYAINCNDYIDEEDIAISLDTSNTKEELMPTLAQKWIDQGWERGIERGIETGIERGIERGKAEGARNGQSRLLRNLIQRRFGSVPTEVEMCILSATEEELEQFANNIFNANTAQEVVGL